MLYRERYIFYSIQVHKCSGYVSSRKKKTPKTRGFNKWKLSNAGGEDSPSSKFHCWQLKQGLAKGARPFIQGMCQKSGIGRLNWKPQSVPSKERLQYRLFFPTDGGAHTSGREHPSRVPRTLFSSLVWLELVNPKETWLSSSRVARRLRAAPLCLFFLFARTATCFVWPKGAEERTFPVSGTRAQSGRRGARPFWWIWW